MNNKIRPHYQGRSHFKGTTTYAGANRVAHIITGYVEGHEGTDNDTD